MSARSARCWAEISAAALRHNASVARERVGPGVELLGVVKANGYGHGIAQVAEALVGSAQLFGVANLQEAIVVREVAAQPIIILGPALPEERGAVADAGFIPSVSSYDEALDFERAAGNAQVAVNLVIDTGMGRMGVPQADALAMLRRIRQLRRITLHSVSTHLPVADEDAQFTTAQLSTFAELVRQLRRETGEVGKIHALLSAGVLAHPDFAFDIVRAGLMLYGSSPLPEFQRLLRPAMALKSRVVLLRNLPAGTSISYGRTFTTSRATKVATISAGYADGYPRAASNRGAAVLVRGQRCAVLGRVTMDLIIVDVTELPNVELGDEVVLIGRQGDEEILAAELAERAGTIAWDVFTGIGSRVPRVYV